MSRPRVERVNRHALTVIRERSGVTMTRLAEDAGVSIPHISDIESGRRQPSPALLARIAAALKVPLVALLANPAEADAR